MDMLLNRFTPLLGLAALLLVGSSARAPAAYYPPPGTNPGYTLTCTPPADDTTDATASLNACLNSFRTALASKSGVLVIAPGKYRTTGPLNFTNIQTHGATILADGVVIDPQFSGGIAVDAHATRFLHLSGLTITTSGENVPDVGFAIGRISSAVADDNYLENLSVTGNYAKAACYNLAGETTTWVKPKCWNAQTGGYGLVLDGYNHWQIPSTFQTVSLTADTAVSFNENLFLTLDARETGGGNGIWLGHVSRHSFPGCYIGLTGGSTSSNVVIYSVSGQPTTSFLNLDCHTETSSAAHAILLSGTTATPAISQLTWFDQQPFANTSLFALDTGVTGAAITGANLHLGTFQAGANLVDTPSAYTFSGSLNMASTTGYNLTQWAGPRWFNGQLAGVPQVICNAGLASGAAPSTTSTSETNLAVCTIPPNTLSANGYLQVCATMFAAAPTAAVKAIRIRYTTTSGATSGYVLKQVSSTTSTQNAVTACGIMYARTSTSGQISNDTSIAWATSVWSVGGHNAATIDTTQTTYVDINAIAGGGTDSVALDSYTVWVMNP